MRAAIHDKNNLEHNNGQVAGRRPPAQSVVRRPSSRTQVQGTGRLLEGAPQLEAKWLRTEEPRPATGRADEIPGGTTTAPGPGQPPHTARTNL